MYCKHIHGMQLRTRKRSHAHWRTHVANAHPTAFKIVARSTNIVRRQRHNSTNIKINIRRTCVRTERRPRCQHCEIIEWPYVMQLLWHRK